jgi:uncharacterized protein
MTPPRLNHNPRVGGSSPSSGMNSPMAEDVLAHQIADGRVSSGGPSVRVAAMAKETAAATQPTGDGPDVRVSEPTEQTAPVQRMFDCALSGDVEGALACFTPDATIDEGDSLPWGGKFHGSAGFVEFMTAIAAECDLSQWVTITDAGDFVVVRGVATFRARATGDAVEMPLVEIHTIRDGKIAHADVYYKDTQAVNELVARARAASSA